MKKSKATNQPRLGFYDKVNTFLSLPLKEMLQITDEDDLYWTHEGLLIWWKLITFRCKNMQITEREKSILSLGQI